MSVKTIAGVECLIIMYRNKNVMFNALNLLLTEASLRARDFHIAQQEGKCWAAIPMHNQKKVSEAKSKGLLPV